MLRIWDGVFILLLIENYLIVARESTNSSAGGNVSKSRRVHLAIDFECSIDKGLTQ